MNAAHLHLLLNHLPVLGTLITIALLAWAIARNPALTRTALTMLAIFAVLGVVVYLTGEPAEEVVEDLAGVSHDILEAHEEAALVATALLAAVGALALGGLVAYRRRADVPRGFAILTLALSLLPAAAMAYTANLGGQIRHSEIRSDAGAAGELLSAPDGELDDH